eukprot:scaffold383_cov229-Chaetoceros_neogracile.AAC.3
MAACDNRWVGYLESGDRSHPNLVMIDTELKLTLTYNGHTDDLRCLENYHLTGSKYDFEQTLHKIKESQNMFIGNRSHPFLVQLDILRGTLTYDGWEDDFKAAEEEHLEDHGMLSPDSFITGMQRKQALHVGDRSHGDIQIMDSLSDRVSYLGWEEDIEEFMWYHTRGLNIEAAKYVIIEKQRMFEGDRSHSRLVALDALPLTYPGWEKDFKNAEEQHLRDDIDELYRSLLSYITQKQADFLSGVADNSSMHPIKRTIVETSWTYKGWEKDVSEAQESIYYSLLEHDLEACKLRQMIHDNDFSSHPALIKLDMLQFTYPGWWTDAILAKVQLCRVGYTHHKHLFDEMLEGMDNKQNLYNGTIQLEAKDQSFGPCAICLTGPRTHIFVPCGHMCTCQPCSNKIMNQSRKCPICSQLVTTVMEVFVP